MNNVNYGLEHVNYSLYLAHELLTITKQINIPVPQRKTREVNASKYNFSK